MIGRLEVIPGDGTVIRFGFVTAWAAPAASPSLLSFLSESARNLASSPAGGAQLADHLAGVLEQRDPEPHVGFAVVGPSSDGWAALLHGPVQMWDGLRWVVSDPVAGWRRTPLWPQPSVSVGPTGGPVPALSPDSLHDLEAGIVPGGGFVLIPSVPVRPAGASGPEATSVLPVAAVPPMETGGPGDGEPPATGDVAAADDVPAAAAVAGEPLAGGSQADEAPADEPPADEPPLDEPLPGEGRPGLAVAGAAAVAEASAVPEPVAPRPTGAGPTGAGPTGAGPTGAGPAGGTAARAPAGVLDLTAADVGARLVPYPPLPPGGSPARSVPGAPVVAGVLCPRGHLNRPGMGDCARCGRPIPDGAPYNVTGTRPALGCLVMDDGRVVRLDTGYLVGSDPARDPTVRGRLARPLVLAGEDVSPGHAEIRLQDWDVAVTDRASAGGTCVYEPHSTAWERLRPYETRVLQPGTHIAFGQRVATYVTPWVPASGR